MKEKLVLIDGHSILNRAFYGVPDLTNSEGLHTNAVYGFLNIMFKILDEEQPDYLVVAFDVKQPTFRHKMFEAYKGTRKPILPELKEQVPVIKDVLRAMDVTICELPGYEADDVLGTLSLKGQEEGMDVSVISGDRDLLQLASDTVKIRIPKTKAGKAEIEDYYAADVKEKYQVTPTEFIDVKALMGDTSDNIPGVPGIGEKTATKLICEYGSIENAYEHVEEIKPNKAKLMLTEHFDLAKMSKKLAAIDRHAPVTCTIAESRKKDFYTQAAFEWMKRLEFKNMLSRFDDVQIENDCEDQFYSTSDLNETEEVFAQAAKKDRLGIAVIADEKSHAFMGVSLSDGEKTCFIRSELFLTQEYLAGKVIELLSSHRGMCATHDIKKLMDFIPLEDEKKLFDCKIAAYLLAPLKDSYETEDLARDYAGLTIPSWSEVAGKKDAQTVLRESPEAFETFACYESYIPCRIKEDLEQKLKESNMADLYFEIELPLAYELKKMEQIGVGVSKEALVNYSSYLGKEIQRLEDTIYEEAGEAFNINSPKQLGEILFGKLALPGGKKTKTGYSTAADVLEKLRVDYPIVEHILSYRQLTKIKSTYADGLVNYIKEDGRIHGRFHQTITATGRISSTDPNLQNIPIRMDLGKPIREAFIPKEGCVFLDADYSQIELRILAHMSGDENLIDAYKTAQDIHRITASKVFHTPLEEVTSVQRSNAKAVNFGIVYGISSFGLSQDLSITRKEAAEYIKQYFATYPGVKNYLDKLVLDGKELGYVTTLFGRRRPVPELTSGNFMQRSFGERVAMNSPIQGTAADIMKIAMIRVAVRLRKEQMKSVIVLQIHDELLVETYEDEIEKVKTILQEEMTHAADLQVELSVEVKAGKNWLEAH